MKIVIEHSSMYEWDKHPDPASITDADKVSLNVKQSHDDSWLKKVVIPKATFTDYGMPWNVIEAALESAKLKGEGMTRNRAIAENLAGRMRSHHHPEHITNIIVEGSDFDDEVRNYLLAYFEVTPCDDATTKEE